MKKLVFCITLGVLSVMGLRATDMGRDFSGAVEIVASPKNDSVLRRRRPAAQLEEEIKVDKSGSLSLSGKNPLPGAVEDDATETSQLLSKQPKIVRAEIFSANNSGAIRALDISFSKNSQKPTIVTDSLDGFVRTWPASGDKMRQVAKEEHRIKGKGKDQEYHNPKDLREPFAVMGVDNTGKHFVVSTSRPGKFKVHERDTGELLCVLPTSQGNVVSALVIKTDHSGKQLLATGSYDKTVRLYEAATCTELHEFKGHESSVTALDMLPTKEGLIIASADMSAKRPTIRLWNTETQKNAGIIDAQSPVQSVSLGADTHGKTIVVSGSKDGQVRIFDANTSKLLKQFQDNSAPRIVKLIHDASNRALIFSVAQNVLKNEDILTVRDLASGNKHSSIHYPVGYSVSHLEIAYDSDDKPWIASSASKDSGNDNAVFVYQLPQESGDDTYIQAPQTAKKGKVECSCL